MKKGLVSKLGATALVLTLVTASLVGGTFAKYTKAVTGTASGTIAKFAFTANTQESTMTLNLTENNKKIAPGDTGTITLNLDASGSETDGTMSVYLYNPSAIPTELKFYSDAGYANEVTIASDTTRPATTTLTQAFSGESTDASRKWDYKLYWKWADTETEVPTNLDLSFNVDAVATQK